MCSECKNFELKLANHSAPSLLGIKCANLISLNKHEFNIKEQLERFNSKAVKKGLKIKQLCSCENRVLIFLYNEKMLSDRLAVAENRDILIRYGYTENMKSDECLKRLSERIGVNGEFPHEIGVFLGYPPEDVIGFIENKGKNFKLCGNWKVYGDVKKAKRVFDNYDKCRRFLCDKLNMGYDIYHALKIV